VEEWRHLLLLLLLLRTAPPPTPAHPTSPPPIPLATLKLLGGSGCDRHTRYPLDFGTSSSLHAAVLFDSEADAAITSILLVH
jgi:hypothetical protein